MVTRIRGSGGPKSGHHVYKVNRRGWWCLRDEVTVGRVGPRGVMVVVFMGEVPWDAWRADGVGLARRCSRGRGGGTAVADVD